MNIPPFLLSSGAKLYPTSYGLLPSVTTILAATESADKRERLRQWQQRHGKSALVGAAERGTAIHEAIAAFSKGESVILPDSLLPFWERALAFLDTLQEIQGCEQRVTHKTQRYAGTLDLAATRFGIPTLFEVKTGDKPKRSLYLEDARHQLAAYWGALNDAGCDPTWQLSLLSPPKKSNSSAWSETNSILTGRVGNNA